MPRLVVVLFVLVAACSAADVAPTTTTPSDPTVTSESPAGSSTSTSVPISTPTPTTSIPQTTTTLAELESLMYQEVASLSFPVHMTALPGSDLAYIATKDGRIWVFNGEQVEDEPALDINGRVRDSGEQGLLAIALHPGDDGRIYLHYSANDGDTVVSEFQFTDSRHIDPTSERRLLRLDQPARNHNGGMILFDHDGFLLLGLGDGGGSGDRFRNGQNTNTLLAGLVSIDVDGDAEPSLHSYGLRNPWRFWIDSGLIYIADVGQNAYEEVSVVEFESGLNYGWPITEGEHCYRPSSGCDAKGITLPVLEVRHGDAGTCSITGGVVYRGSLIPELNGTYFYSDYCGGYLRSFRFDDSEVSAETDWTDQVGVPGRIVSFGVDGSDEMYVLTRDKVLKVEAIRQP